MHLRTDDQHITWPHPTSFVFMADCDDVRTAARGATTPTLHKYMTPCNALAPVMPFLSMTVAARLQTLQTTLKLPRQVVSDKKWEGASWMQAAQRGQHEPAHEKKGACPPLPPPSCSASEEDDDEDDSSTDGADDAQQRLPCKDKDVVPSRMHWVWDVDSMRWVRKERPRLHAAGIFFSFTTLPPKHVDLLRNLLADPRCPLTEHFLRTELVPRLNREHAVSLRALDWFMVDYARENNVAYLWPDTAGVLRVVNVHDKYERLLKCWRRRRFDCFRRRHRIYFELDATVYSTTVAQLHFFFVAHTYGFLEFARRHLKDIDAHLKETMARNQQMKRAKSNKKRQALVRKANPCMLVSRVPSVMNFTFPDMA